MVDFARIGGAAGRLFGGGETVTWAPASGGVASPIPGAIVDRGTTQAFDLEGDLAADDVGIETTTIVVSFPTVEAPAIGKGDTVTVSGVAHEVARLPRLRPDGTTSLMLRRV